MVMLFDLDNTHNDILHSIDIAKLQLCKGWGNPLHQR